jgi:CheY-like chemotaxis protein
VRSRSVLIVENDLGVAEVASAVLQDEGYTVTIMRSHNAVRLSSAVAQLEPDLILLDGESEVAGYGRSWDLAASIAERGRPIPVIMFTAHGRDVREARDALSSRSKRANFAAIIGKPFDVDELLRAVARVLDGAGTAQD